MTHPLFSQANTRVLSSKEARLVFQTATPPAGPDGAPRPPTRPDVRNEARDRAANLPITIETPDAGVNGARNRQQDTRNMVRISRQEMIGRLSQQLNFIVGVQNGLEQQMRDTNRQFVPNANAAMYRGPVNGALNGANARDAYGRMANAFPQLQAVRQQRAVIERQIITLNNMERTGMPDQGFVVEGEGGGAGGQGNGNEGGRPAGGPNRPDTRFNLNQSLGRMNPDTRRTVTDLPTELQEPVARNMETMTDQERTDALSGLRKINDALRRFPILRQLRLIGPNGGLMPMDEVRRQPAPAGAGDLAPAFTAWEQTLNGITPQERAAMQKVLDTTRPAGGTGGGGRDRAPGGGIETVSPNERAMIERGVQRVRSATTQEERDIGEGMLRMYGVDVDSPQCNIQSGRIIMLSPDDGMGRFLGIVQGIIQMVGGVVNKKKRTPLGGPAAPGGPSGGPAGAPNAPPPNPATMTPEARNTELAAARIKVQQATVEETRMTGEIATLRARRANPATPSETHPALDAEIARMVTQLTELQQARAAVQARIAALEAASGPAAPPTAPAEQPLTLEQASTALRTAMTSLNVPGSTSLIAIQNETGGRMQVVVDLGMLRATYNRVDPASQTRLSRCFSALLPREALERAGVRVDASPPSNPAAGNKLVNVNMGSNRVLTNPMSAQEVRQFSEGLTQVTQAAGRA